MNSVILEPKYPILNTNDGYCIRTNFEGCVTTTPNGELISKGKILHNIIIEGKDSKKERGAECSICFIHYRYSSQTDVRLFKVLSYFIYLFIYLTSMAHRKKTR